MPIKNFDSIIYDVKASSSFQIEVLKNSRIGIDAEYYISKLIMGKREPNLEAIGGFPMTFQSLLERDLKAFEELNITPVFILPGLQTVDQYKYYDTTKILPVEEQIRRAWSERASSSSKQDPFRDSNTSLPIRPIMNEFLSLLTAKGVSFLVAPYSAVVQLAYMYSNDMIDVVYSSTDCLLVNNCFEKIVSTIDLDARIFRFYDKASLLSKLNLSAKQFRDIVMCLGNGFQPTPINPSPRTIQLVVFSTLRDFLMSTGSIYNAIYNLQDQTIMDTFQKGCSSIEYMPVLKENGKVEPMGYSDDETFLNSHALGSSTAVGSPLASHNLPSSAGTSATGPSTSSSSTASTEQKTIPNDLYEIVGQRLPDELFFYQSVGFDIFQLCETLSHGYAIERLPLDMVSSPALYSKLVTDIAALDLKGKVINLLSSSLNRYYQNKKLHLHSYIKGSQTLELSQKFSPLIYSTVTPLVIHHPIAQSFDLNTLFASISNQYIQQCKLSYRGPRIVVNDDHEHLISTNYELISTATLRSLYLLEFLDENSYELNKWGSDTFELISKSSNSEKLFLIVFLLKKFEKTLSVSDLTNPNDFKSTAKPPETECCVLISKIVSLLQIKNLKPVSYPNVSTSKLSRDLLQFRSLMDKINSNINELITANILALLLSNSEDVAKYKRLNNDWRKLACEVPFAKSLPSNILGLVSQHFWETYYIKTSSLPSSKPELLVEGLKDSIKATNEKFSEVHDNSYFELTKGFRFFKEVASMVELLHGKKLVSDRIAALFANSEALIDTIIE